MDVKPQAVEIVMRDGKAFSEKVVYPKGNPNNPVSSEELVAAFRGMASYAAKPLGGAKIDEAIAWQSKAVALTKGEDAEIAAALAKYKKAKGTI